MWKFLRGELLEVRIPLFSHLSPIADQLPCLVGYAAKILDILSLAVFRFGELVDVTLTLTHVRLLVDIVIVRGFCRSDDFLHFAMSIPVLLPVGRRLAVKEDMVELLFLSHICLDVIGPEPGV